MQSVQQANPSTFGTSHTMSASTTSEIHPFGGDATKQLNLDTETPLTTQAEDLYKLINDVNVCMLTTRRQDGHLVSRAMSVREVQPGANLVFITNNQTGKIDELQNDDHVNLTFYRDQTKEWASICGTARIENDRALINKYWGKDLESWFGDLGDGIHDGSAADPRISLLMVKSCSVHYQFQDKSAPRRLFERVKSAVTHEVPSVAAIRELNAGDLEYVRKLPIEEKLRSSTIQKIHPEE